MSRVSRTAAQATTACPSGLPRNEAHDETKSVFPSCKRLLTALVPATVVVWPIPAKPPIRHFNVLQPTAAVQPGRQRSTGISDEVKYNISATSQVRGQLPGDRRGDEAVHALLLFAGHLRPLDLPGERGRQPRATWTACTVRWATSERRALIATWNRAWKRSLCMLRQPRRHDPRGHSRRPPGVRRHET